MNRIAIFLAIFLLVFAIIVGAVWFLGGKQENSTPESKVPAAELTKSSGDTNPGNVSVDVTLITKENAPDFYAGNPLDLDKQFVFYVEMNTHSVDISSYKMADISFLTASGKSIKASKWVSTDEGGGHHRNGSLVFKKSAEAKQLKLIIKGIPNIAEREFEWKL